MQKIKTLFFVGIAILSIMCNSVAAAAKVSINPKNAVIVLPEKMRTAYLDKSYEKTAEELQKHLELIGGTKIPVIQKNQLKPEQYPFYVQQRSPKDKKEFAFQEVRWEITPKAAYFYGKKDSTTGAMFAIYDFLEKQFGVLWIRPGDSGIVYKKHPEFVLNIGKYNWIPRLMFRKIRQRYRITRREPVVSKRMKPFPEFMLSMKENNKKAEDDMIWQKRMRMGGSRPGGGHSFTKWWDKYGKTHPEYFALNKYGKREPVKLSKGAKATKEFIKICPSCPGVAQQIIENWLPGKDRVQYINSGMNDSTQNFCECANCKKLDVTFKGEDRKGIKAGNFAYPGGDKYVHLTDRYVYLANAVAREARKHRKDAKVSMYAYLTTLHPPRKLKVEPNVVPQIVPYVIPLELKITEDLIGGWYKAGAKEIAFRPNYHFKYHPFPMHLGFEKDMFDVFQVAVRNGCISAEYDSLMGSWDITGMADYILARALAQPDKPFTYWEKEYYSAFGNASADIEKYFKYWREKVWNARLKPNVKKLAKLGRYGNFARGLAWSLHARYRGRYKPEVGSKYFKTSDFDITDKFLQEAASKNLTPAEKKRVEQLILANKHSRLVYGAMYNRGTKGYEYAKQLLAFRKANRNKMDMSWCGFFYSEDVWGDICKLKLASYLEKYPLPWIKTPFKWRFEIDEKNVGLKEKWQDKSWDKTKDWKSIRVNVPWSNTYECPYKALKKKLKTYDGIGWYTFRQNVPVEMKKRKVFLYFGGVDDSCWVYVNGKLAGEHIAKDAKDTNTPFEIEITKQIDWTKKYQTVTVRVEDKGGRGGVHKETWLVSRKED